MDTIRDKLKKAFSGILNFIINNCITILVGSIGFVSICEGVRLWMRSFFSKYYELTFIFLCFAFIVGFIIGSCKRFEEFYKQFSRDYERKKRREEDAIRKFKRFNHYQKTLIQEIYIKGSIIHEVENLEAFLNDFDSNDFESQNLEIEIIDDFHVRATLNKNTYKFVKKHPELLDVLK
jgi:hypothetical protein